MTEEDDLYSGYNDFQLEPTPTTPSTALRLGTAAGFKRESTARTGIFSRSGRPLATAAGRPMTAVRGAGYTASGRDPLQKNSAKKPAPSLEPKIEDSPEERIRALEEKIGATLEASVLAGCKGEPRVALELAKDAAAKEKALMKLKEVSPGANESHDWDLTFSVLFTLARAYEGADHLSEALTTYSAICKNKLLVHGPKVRVNMGNIYARQGAPHKAIKSYRMAIDQLNSSHKELRLKLMQNMGLLFLQMGQPGDAAASFEYIMTERPSFHAGLHLAVAAFMGGEREKMKGAFRALLAVPLNDEDEEKYGGGAEGEDPVSQLLLEVLKSDRLRKLEKGRKLYGERAVLSAARLIAPAIEPSVAEGYVWVTEEIRGSRHAPLAHALEISKALVFLKQRELSEAADILKSFDKKETKVATAAATNLSFIYFLEGELEQAEKYGMMATAADFYNSVAYVNLGACAFVRGEWEEAKKCYSEAIGIDASGIEALYNLGLVNQALQFYEEALECFHKVQSLVRNHPHVAFQLGRTHELRGEHEVAVEWYLKALALVPSDAGLLKKLGELADLEGDRQGAYQHYYDCHKYDPSDMEVIEWLAGYLQELQLPDKALSFYARAQILSPEDPKWPIHAAAAHRRMGNYSQALSILQKVHKEHPEHQGALSGLARLTSDMGLKEAEGYREALSKLERASESRLSSGGSRSRFGPPSRMGSSRPRQSAQGQLSQTQNSSQEFGSDGDLGWKSESLDEDDLGADDFMPPPRSARPETAGRGRPKTAAETMEELDAFFSANQVGSEMLPI